MSAIPHLSLNQKAVNSQNRTFRRLSGYYFLYSCLCLSACGTLRTSESPIASPPSLAAASEDNVQLGLAYLATGDIPRAKYKLLLALKQAPRSGSAASAMAWFLDKTGEPQAAEQHYRKAVALSPKSGAVQNNYGVFLCRHGRYQEAETHFLQAVQDPDYLNTASVYENLGVCALQARNISQAKFYLEKNVTQNPQHASAWLSLARLNWQQQNVRRAQEAFERYRHLAGEPRGAEALWLGTQLARALKQPENAGHYLLALQSQYPDSPYTRHAMSRIQAVSREKEGKRLYY